MAARVRVLDFALVLTWMWVRALVAQGIEHWFPVPGVGGSNPLEGTFLRLGLLDGLHALDRVLGSPGDTIEAINIAGQHNDLMISA